MTSKVYVALFVLFACCVTISADQDNFQGTNGEKLNHQNGPLNSYEIIFKQISKFSDIE